MPTFKLLIVNNNYINFAEFTAFKIGFIIFPKIRDGSKKKRASRKNKRPRKRPGSPRSERGKPGFLGTGLTNRTIAHSSLGKQSKTARRLAQLLALCPL